MISFATNPAFTPDLPAHSFQAPTLIGCQIFKEQGTAYSVLLSCFPDISLSRFVSEAEKRDYEGLFRHCQIDIGLFLQPDDSSTKTLKKSSSVLNIYKTFVIFSCPVNQTS